MEAVNEIKIDNLKLIVFGAVNKNMRRNLDYLFKSDKIINLGWIASNEVYDYFLASDLAVFPGTHSVLWEQSIGTGIPGIFKYWKGMDHVDLGGNCRFLYNDEKQEIKNTILEIVNAEAIFDKMKKVSEDKGIPKFSYKEIARIAIEI
jgi:glycosyltransferase involved in cell wall biosynthesis